MHILSRDLAGCHSKVSPNHQDLPQLSLETRTRMAERTSLHGSIKPGFIVDRSPSATSSSSLSSSSGAGGKGLSAGGEVTLDLPALLRPSQYPTPREVRESATAVATSVVFHESMGTSV